MERASSAQQRQQRQEKSTRPRESATEAKPSHLGCFPKIAFPLAALGILAVCSWHVSIFHDAVVTATKASAVSSATKALADENPSARVVVSLKTIPSRIRHIEPTVASLLHGQDMPLDDLYVVLPRKKWVQTKDEPIDYGDLPPFLSNETEPRLTILRPEYDYGPVDKMLHTLQLEEKSSKNDLVIIYLDDDIIYHRDLVRTLVTKAVQYPDSAVALSGCTLRSQFRQIKHQFPREKFDKHPNLYYRTSGTPSLPNDEVADIVQGFAGVLIRPGFFNVSEFFELVEEVTRYHDVWKADDFIIAGYLAKRNVTRRLVASNVTLTINRESATKDNVGRTMHVQVMQAAFELQRRLGIWTEHEFVDYLTLDVFHKDLIDCEAGHAGRCPSKKGNASAAPPNAARPKHWDAVGCGEATLFLDAYFYFLNKDGDGPGNDINRTSF